MEDLLPLLIFVVILIVNIGLAKRKDSKQTQTDVPNMSGETDAETARDTNWEPMTDDDWEAVLESVGEEDADTTMRETAAYNEREPAVASWAQTAKQASTSSYAYALGQTTTTAPPPYGRPANQAAGKKVSTNVNGIRLRTKSDARRAFIYSEIFNRKYNT